MNGCYLDRWHGYTHRAIALVAVQPGRSVFLQLLSLISVGAVTKQDVVVLCFGVFICHPLLRWKRKTDRRRAVQNSTLFCFVLFFVSLVKTTRSTSSVCLCLCASVEPAGSGRAGPEVRLAGLPVRVVFQAARTMRTFLLLTRNRLFRRADTRVVVSHRKTQFIQIVCFSLPQRCLLCRYLDGLSWNTSLNTKRPPPNCCWGAMIQPGLPGSRGLSLLKRWWLGYKCDGSSCVAKRLACLLAFGSGNTCRVHFWDYGAARSVSPDCSRGMVFALVLPSPGRLRHNLF